MAVPPLVPGFTVTAELSSHAGELHSAAAGSTWLAVRTLDGKPLVLEVIPVIDALEAQARAAELRAVLGRMVNTHLVGQHGAFPWQAGRWLSSSIGSLAAALPGLSPSEAT